MQLYINIISISYDSVYNALKILQDECKKRDSCNYNCPLKKNGNCYLFIASPFDYDLNDFK